MLQDCCTFQSEDMNIGVEYLAEQKQAWVLSSWEIKIRRYPVMGEKICVETWPYAFKGFYGYRNFRITNGRGEKLVLANSVWVYMDMERMRPMRIPEKVADAYRPEIGEELPGEWGARKLSVPEGYVYVIYFVQLRIAKVKRIHSHGNTSTSQSLLWL